MNASELVQAAMQKTGCTSARQLAAKCNVSNVSASKWIRGEVCPTFEQACELAILAGLPPVKTAAEVRQGSIDGAKHRNLLRRLASMAAGVALVAGIAAPPANASTEANVFAKNGHSVYYVKLRQAAAASWQAACFL